MISRSFATRNNAYFAYFGIIGTTTRHATSNFDIVNLDTVSLRESLCASVAIIHTPVLPRTRNISPSSVDFLPNRTIPRRLSLRSNTSSGQVLRKADVRRSVATSSCSPAVSIAIPNRSLTNARNWGRYDNTKRELTQWVNSTALV